MTAPANSIVTTAESVTTSFSNLQPVATLNRTCILKLETSAASGSNIYDWWIATGGVDLGNTLNLGTQIGTYGYDVIVNSVQITNIDEGMGKYWNVVITATSNQPAESTGFLAYSASVGGTYVDVWRNVAPPANGTANSSNINGTKIDSGGKPVSKFVVQSSVQTTRRTATPNWSGIFAAVGKRNSDAYDGAAAGMLLFTGINVATVSQGMYEVSYQYLSDSFYHCRQLAILEDGDGRTMCDSSQAKDVRWVQPHPETIAFGDLFV